MLGRHYPRAWARKLTDAKLYGILDWLIINEGRVMFAEAKRPEGGKASEIQKQTVRQIREAGGEAFIFESAEELKTIMAKAKGEETDEKYHHAND